MENKNDSDNEDILIICLDENANHQTEIANELIDIVYNFKLFVNVDECIDYITSVSPTKYVFLILFSHQFILSYIDQLPQIRSIYLFHTNPIEYEKIENVFSDKQLLLNKLNNDVKLFSNQLPLPMTFFNNIDDNVKEKSVKDLSNESQYFMYMHLFIEILLRHSQRNEAEQEFLDEVRRCYDSNKKQLEIIDQFKQDYEPNQAIRWYTRDCFIYRSLNQALRYQDFDKIYKFRYIIKDLYKQLKQLYNEQSLELKKFNIVYRGQFMRRNELNIFEVNQGKLVSMNTFLSTTLDKNTASGFIPGGCAGDIVPVLFEINIVDSNFESTPYAYIENYSFMQHEQEILFSMDCIFRIDLVEQSAINDEIYSIKLTLTNQHEQENVLKALTDYMKKQMYNNVNDFGALAFLMASTGHYDKAIYYSELLLKDLPLDSPIIPTLYNNIGTLYKWQGNRAEALHYYEKALNIALKILPENHPDTAATYHHIAVIHQDEPNYADALDYYTRALDTQLKSLPENHLDIAAVCNSIGDMHRSLGNYDKALKYLKRTLEIRLASLPENHPDIAKIYADIGLLYQNQGHFNDALQYLEHALRIESKCLPVEHPNLAKTYQRIGSIHLTGQIYRSIEMYE
ncbi:hypothetical protein I4U23_004342 [Adineta vaga]|nr:hypothetical protein I4U23_004342 [Adineta vaga]